MSSSRLEQVELGTNTNLALDKLLALQNALRLDSIEALLGPSASATMAGLDVGMPRGNRQ